MRTFIAIELPQSVQNPINQVQIALQAHLREQQCPESIQWTPVAKIHLTLRFLGETSASQQEFITPGLSEIAQRQPAFVLSLSDLGCFPNFRAPSVVWLGLQGELTALQQLQQQLEQLARKTDFVPENRAFAPHITLGRARRSSSPSDLHRTGAALQQFQAAVTMQRHSNLSSEPFVVDQFVHIQSELQPGGARYTPIKRYMFG
ncbi:RNA 2',3'-cyclic phosphodiesterase [soil metagenome]